MTVDLCWFSFSGDALSLQASLLAAKRSLPHAGRHVFDDAKSPITGGALRSVESLASYEQTTFERRGNLNGKACILGQIDCYLRSGKEGGIVCKVDSDTMLFRPQFLPEAFEADPNLLGAGIRCPAQNGFWGPWYGYRHEALEPLARIARDTLCPTCRLPEDLTMSGILRREAPARARLFETTSTAGYFTGYNYKTSLTLREYIQRFRVITFGSRFTQWGKDFLTPAQQRGWQGETMHLALKTWLDNS